MGNLSLVKVEVKQQGIVKGTVFVFADNLDSIKNFYTFISNRPDIEINVSAVNNTAIEEKTRMMFLAGIEKQNKEN